MRGKGGTSFPLVGVDQGKRLFLKKVKKERKGLCFWGKEFSSAK